MEVPQNWWFIMEYPAKLDGVGVPLFQETSSWPNKGTGGSWPRAQKALVFPYHSQDCREARHRGGWYASTWGWRSTEKVVWWLEIPKLGKPRSLFFQLWRWNSCELTLRGQGSEFWNFMGLRPCLNVSWSHICQAYNVMFVWEVMRRRGAEHVPPQPGRCFIPNMAHQLILIRDKNPAPPLANMLIGVATSTYLNKGYKSGTPSGKYVD